MKKLFIIPALIFGLFGCEKKESPIPVHNIQFSSNIIDEQYYDLTINGDNNADITKVYDIEGSVDIELKLYAAGGDTTSVNGGDSLWTYGVIRADGLTVKSYVGYRDAVLSYHIK